MKTILVDAVNCLLIKEKGINKKLLIELEKIKTKKIIVTNASIKKLKDMGFDNLPYEIFTCEGNPNKSNPNYFKKLLERKNLLSNHCLYIDHKKENLESANKYKIKGLHFTGEDFNYECIKKELDSL